MEDITNNEKENKANIKEENKNPENKNIINIDDINPNQIKENNNSEIPNQEKPVEIKEKENNSKINDNNNNNTENLIYDNIIKDNDNLNKINIDNQRKSDPENYEIERECSIENIHKLIIKDEKYTENITNLKINDLIQIPIKPEDLKCNKEYQDNNDDIKSRRFATKDNNDKYLIIKEEQNNKNINNNENYNSDSDYESDKEDEKKDYFPFRIIGDAEKKSQKLGIYNNRYLEIDSHKGLFKRYKTSKDYPKKPNDIVDIRNFKLIRKLKRVKDYYDLEITYTVTKKGEKIEKVENYRLRHFECRNKWFDLLLLLWRYLIKGTPVPKFTNKFLLFVDDRIGILQEIRENKNKDKGNTVKLRNFKFLGLLGVGGFGTVFKVKHILTDKIYAMKVMNKNYIIQKKYLHYVVSEFEIMKSLTGFPFVLDLHYCFQSANYLYLIIDYCPNGDFTKLKYINNIRLFLAEVILAFEHIHNHNVIYRDLKPENILLDSSGHIRICDFNLAKANVPKDKRADSFCGSPMYLSPEMLTGKGVDYRCDIYGIGLLMYELVTGTPAFNAKDIQSLYELIRANHIDFKAYGISGDIKDLLEKILVKNPEERISIEEMKKHPYFKNIDFNKVLKKAYGPIITEKKTSKINDDISDKKISEEELEKRELMKFRLQQQKLDDNKDYSFLEGKITVREMYRDQKRIMKNYVREFYFVKKEDLEQTKDYKLDLKGNIDISKLIKEK